MSGLGRAWSFAREVVESFLDESPFQLAAALSFYTLLSLSPLVLVVVSTAGLVWGEPAVREQLVREVEGLAGPAGGDAVKLVVEFGKASTSLLQRRLRIGYGRAAHLIDLMEQDGIVGVADGPKPREVLKRPDWISEIEESMR